MAQRKTDPSSRGRPDRAALWGRRIGTILVWGAIIYIVAVGFATVLPQVFAPEAKATTVSRCEEGLFPLRQELLTRLQPVPRGAPADGADFERWLTDWDARHAGLRTLCRRRGADAHEALLRLRYRLETRKRRADHEIGPLLDEVDRELSALPTPSEIPPDDHR